jgi:hypothetical protein
MALITVHEIGHWLMGRVAGIPAENMKIRLLTFPQQVMLRSGEQWLSITSGFDQYNTALTAIVPSRGGRFLYVAGGFLFETCFLIALTVVLARSGFWLFALVAPGVSLLMFVIYLFAMDIPQVRKTQRPWGDTSILYSLAPRAAIAVAAGMVFLRIALAMAVAFRLI